VTAMVRVKICGITSLLDARAACDAGANYLGFNFYEKSPRCVARTEAIRIRSQLPPNIEAVGIFVNLQPADIIALAASVRLKAAQLHGDETPQIVADLSRTISVIKAFRVDGDFRPEILAKFPKASAFLLDAAEAGQYGGTGQTFDWSIAQQAAKSHRIILAGGLKVGNVAEAIRTVRPFAVDVASGVETKSGKKDHCLMREFILEVRRAEKELDSEADSEKTGTS
jgi:phosphoribosylanthranilate isomerase